LSDIITRIQLENVMHTTQLKLDWFEWFFC